MPTSPAAHDDARPELLIDEGDAVVAVAGAVMVSLFRAPSVQRLRQVGLAATRRFGRQKEGVGSLVVLDPSPNRANVDAATRLDRDELGQGMARVGNFVRGTAVVLEYSGFAAASLRALFAGVRLMARLPYPLKTFESLDPAARWLVPLVSAPAEAESALVRVVSTVAWLRAHADKR